MATPATGPSKIHQTTLENYLVSMARTVESSVNRAIEALLTRNSEIASGVFLTEPRINEMEIIIDNHAIRLLHEGNASEDGIRHIVACLKINNDLERMGDLAVNISQRVISLSQMPDVAVPSDLEPMSASVRSMVSRCLGALTWRNVTLANEILDAEPAIDEFRDRMFESLLSEMKQDPSLIGPNMQFVLAVRNLERICDHTTNIAEDVVFWLQGLDIRHGKANSFKFNDLNSYTEDM
ncbi:MAG: phosphate signaling complex protein PhoU [Candidatus Acidiferrales bacterium]